MKNTNLILLALVIISTSLIAGWPQQLPGQQRLNNQPRNQQQSNLPLG